MVGVSSEIPAARALAVMEQCVERAVCSSDAAVALSSRAAQRTRAPAFAFDRPVASRATTRPKRSSPISPDTRQITEMPAERILGEQLRALALNFGLQGGIYIHFGHAIYAVGAPARFAASSLADRRFYIDEAALAADPVSRRAVHALTPFVWTTTPAKDGGECEHWSCARLKGRGIQGGVAIPVQDYAAGPACVSLYSAFAGEAEALISARGPELVYTAAAFHEEAKARLPQAASAGARHALTPREIECLRLAALGWSVNESAEALLLTPRTVEFHLKNAADKFGAPNKLRAVVMAVGCGLIVP